MEKEKTVVLGITGSIAAYKACEITREIIRRGLPVVAVMTRNATKFVTPLTFQALTGNRVVAEQFEILEKTDIEHIELSKRASLLLVAPATANIISKFACGIADDFLSTFYLAFEGPVLIAPAMNTRMWRSEPVRENVEKLEGRGVEFIDPVEGGLACGEEGPGKLATVQEIAEKAIEMIAGFSEVPRLTSQKWLVTAGPCYEDMDPVRFIGNRSSGRMGVAVAGAASSCGADVLMVHGPLGVRKPVGIRSIAVRSSREMKKAIKENMADVDVLVMAAAVSDFRPARISREKIERRKGGLKLELLPNEDIIGSIGKMKKHPFLVGFSAESGLKIERARTKLREKKLDLIVLNDITREGCGFDSDTNSAVIIGEEGVLKKTPVMKKTLLAFEIVEIISERFDK